jgi:PleD family two-component response regulator
MAHLVRSSHAIPVRRVLVADGDPSVRSALRLVLCQAVGLNVVEEASDAAHLLVAAAASAPDLVLLDWNLPGWHPDDAPWSFPPLRPACFKPQSNPLGGR